MPIELEKIISQLNDNSWTVPQPEGREVAEAYQSGKLSDQSTLLHVIAVLLSLARKEK